METGAKPAPSPGEKGPSSKVVPRPVANQTWVHSCCSRAKLQAALADPTISAIEADIMMPAPSSSGRAMPIMAHPSWRSKHAPQSDLDFATFIDRCIEDGKRHLKLDFKQAAAVEPCLQLLAKRWHELQGNRQAIWLNADVLPGPNARGKVEIAPDTFLPLCRRYCPHAFLSLGWRVGPIGPEEAYSQSDIAAMAKVCGDYSLDGGTLVFAASLRLSERALPVVASVLTLVPGSQLLLWTGFGEAPVRSELHERVSKQLDELEVGPRVGFDISVAQSVLGSATSDAIDCTFFWSRWTRYIFCGDLCCGSSYSLLNAQTGERETVKEYP